MAKKSLLEQWQDRAIEAEARVKRAIEILRHSDVKSNAAVGEALDVLKKGAIEEPTSPDVNIEGMKTGRMQSAEENVAGAGSKGSPRTAKAGKPTKKSLRGTDRNAM